MMRLSDLLDVAQLVSGRARIQSWPAHSDARAGAQRPAGSQGALRSIITFEPTHAHCSCGSWPPIITLGAGLSWGSFLPWLTWGDKRQVGALRGHCLAQQLPSTINPPIVSAS